MILDINKDNIDLLRQGANLLLNDMKDFSAEFCPTFEAAMEKMQRCACDERICRGYVDETGTLLGWIGAIEQYIRTGWELHPLIVKRDARKRGIGSALIRDLENTIRSRGGITIYLGTDDEHNRTTLSGVDLYIPIFGIRFETFEITADILTSSIRRWVTVSSESFPTRTESANPIYGWQNGSVDRKICYSIDKCIEKSYAFG